MSLLLYFDENLKLHFDENLKLQNQITFNLTKRSGSDNILQMTWGIFKQCRQYKCL